MPSFGTLDHYVKGTSFTNYMERLDHLASFNLWTEENKKSVLIALTGPVVYDELKLIFPTVELKTLKYVDMVKKLKERFDKVDPDMMQRFYFYNRFQKSDESAESFILSVKLQAELCNFQEFKETAIRDRLIMGMHDRELQKSLLMSETLTLEIIEKKLLSSEIANKQTKVMTGEHPEHRNDEVHSVKNRLGKKKSVRVAKIMCAMTDLTEVEVRLGMRNEVIFANGRLRMVEIVVHMQMQFAIIVKRRVI